MKNFFLSLLFFATTFSWVLGEEVYDLQLRSRGKDGSAVQYRTVRWDSGETAFVHRTRSRTSPWYHEMAGREKALLDFARKSGSPVVGSPKDLAGNDRIKNVIFLGVEPRPFETPLPGKNLALLRDLTDVPGEKPFEREKQVIESESQGVASISSVDFLGGGAFRYSADKRPHVVVMVSDDHYKADTWMPLLAGKFQVKHALYFTVLHGEGGELFHGIDELESADSLVVYFRRLSLRKDQLEKVIRYVESGRGVVGLRTATHAFSRRGKIPEGHANWDRFDADVLGGSYTGHGNNAVGSEIWNVKEMEQSSILKGVKPSVWHSTGSVYDTAPVKEDATIYQYAASSEKGRMPLTWTRMYGKTRVAFTALGHWDDVDVPAFQRLYLNMILWSLDK